MSWLAIWLVDSEWREGDTSLLLHFQGGEEVKSVAVGEHMNTFLNSLIDSDFEGNYMNR